MSEPLPPLRTSSKDYDPIIMGPVIAKPEGFTTWDKLDVNAGDGTMQAFLKHLEKEFSIEVSIVSQGSICLYNSYSAGHKKRLASKVTDIWEEISKQKISPKRCYLTLEVSATDMDQGAEVQVPAIRYIFRPSAFAAPAAVGSGGAREGASLEDGTPRTASSRPRCPRLCPRRA